MNFMRGESEKSYKMTEKEKEQMEDANKVIHMAIAVLMIKQIPPKIVAHAVAGNLKNFVEMSVEHGHDIGMDITIVGMERKKGDDNAKQN